MEYLMVKARDDAGVIRKAFDRRDRQDSVESTKQCQRTWIERVFFKRECCKFIASSRDPTKCCCGRGEAWHGNLEKEFSIAIDKDERWHPLRHTDVKPTDAYGTLEFQGAPHPSKAQYVRLSSFDSKSEYVLELLQKFWGLDLPKLLITVHGGILNFDLQPKLKRVFRKGLLKAAKTTGAWIITGGTNTGVTRHVGDAISDRTTKAKNKVVAIGISPWGIVENREDLTGRDVVVPYHCVSSTKNSYAVLNSNHSYFLLIDNGTVGKYGGEILFRKKLEKYISQQKICINSGVKGRGVPVICVVLEGGANTIRSVLEYVTDSPPVPVVVCDGSGRAADLLAFTHKYMMEDGTMPESLRDQLILTIQKTFQYSLEQAEKLFIELMLCVKKKELITVFRMGEGAPDIDLAILTALLKAVTVCPSAGGTNASAPDQLSLTLTWDRVDLARSHIFVYGQEWPEGSLEQAMMDALINDRVDFVRLLLENGVSMRTFLTIPRLEELYNTRQGPSNTLRYLIRDVKKHAPSTYRYTLPDIGLVLQHLMGGAFRSNYCRKRFRQKYYAIKQNGTSLGNVVTSIPTLVNTKQAEELFSYPFHDLMVWAVLMKRQKMSLFMWQHGEEAMAKALLACKLYKAMAHEADQDDLEVDISDELRSYAKEFQTLALELLEHCYKVDDDYTQQLLTYELKNFSEQTCLSLAVAGNHREFIAHACCQFLLNDMWMGGLRMRKSTSLKVILGILLPPYILALEFKSKEELQLMPQTMEEHLEDLEEEASDNDRLSLRSFDEDQNDYGDDVMESNFHFTAQTASKQPDTMPTTTVAGPSSFPDKPPKKKSPLRLGKKVYEFYNAPITKFWAHTMAYMTFLLFFTYTVLFKTIPVPRWQECYVIGYIGTLALEKVRQLIASEPVKIVMKVRMYVSEIWNIWDTLAILLFSIGVVLRFFPGTLQASRLVYIVDIVLWYIRILEILSVNKYLGPYVKIIGKLVVDMSYFLIILFIVLVSFGIVRQSVHFQEEEASWMVVRNLFFYPYWMIYGELFADEIDPCQDENGTCGYGAWVAPALMCMYLLVANILLVNLLIARFNATFILNNKNSREIWKFQRYQLIIAYELRPLLPPPLIFFSHLFLAFKYIKRRCKGKRDYFDNGLKLFLSNEDTEKLHDFEEECVEDYFREKELKFQSSSEERIRVISERVENMTLRMEDINQKENSIKMSLQTVDYRLSKMEEICFRMADSLSIIEDFQRLNGAPFPNTPLLQRVDSDDSFIVHDDLPIYSGETPTKQQDEKNLKLSLIQAEEKLSNSQTTVRSVPSPVLIHSKKPVHEEHIQRLTDYTKPNTTVGTPIFSAIRKSLSFKKRKASSTPQQKRRHSLLSKLKISKGSQSKEAGSTSPTVATSQTPSLLERRNGSTFLYLNLDRDDEHSNLESTISVSSESGSHPPVTFQIGPITDKPLMYSTAAMKTDTHTATLIPGKTMTLDLLNPAEAIGVTGHTPISPLITPVSPTRNINTVSCYSSDVSRMSCTSTQISSILTSIHPEYTTITDEIDTSCMIDTSPHASPSSAGGFFGDNFSEREVKPERKSMKSEEKVLKQAEETGHRRMEKVIRHRLRQISQDDSDTVSEITKMVTELEREAQQEKTAPDQGEDEEADEDDDDFQDAINEASRQEVEIRVSGSLDEENLKRIEC